MTLRALANPMAHSRTFQLVFFTSQLLVALAVVITFSALVVWPEWKKHRAVAELLKQVANPEVEGCGVVEEGLPPVIYFGFGSQLEAVSKLDASELAANSLGPLLKHHDLTIRYHAAYVLGCLGSDARPALSTLKETTSDDDTEFAKMIAWCLSKIDPALAAEQQVEETQTEN